MAETSPQDGALLDALAAKHGLSSQLIRELMQIEKDYFGSGRRHGIYDRLRECLQTRVAEND